MVIPMLQEPLGAVYLRARDHHPHMPSLAAALGGGGGIKGPIKGPKANPHESPRVVEGVYPLHAVLLLAAA